LDSCDPQAHRLAEMAARLPDLKFRIANPGLQQVLDFRLQKLLYSQAPDMGTLQPEDDILWRTSEASWDCPPSFPPQMDYS
jgi:hypothetical protein